METRRDQLGRFPMTNYDIHDAPQRWPSHSIEPSDHPLARNIQLVLAGGAVLLTMLSGSFGGGIGLLILCGFYALGYCFPNRWLIGGIPIAGVVGYAVFYAIAESMARRPNSDSWDLLGLFLLFLLVAFVLSAVWLGAVVGALVTHGDRKHRAEPVNPGRSDW